jgi:iron complex transport system substrate-binding protein
MHINRRALTGSLVAVPLLGVLATDRALGQATPGASPVAAGAAREIEHPRGTTLVPADPQRVVALGEEWLLADLLSLGITPVASSGNYASGYVGIDPAYKPEIPVFTTSELDIEVLIGLKPDLILVHDIYFDFMDGLFENLSQIAPTVAIPDVDAWQENYRFTAAVFGMEAVADTEIAALEVEIADAAAELDLAGQTVSVATVYPGGDGFALWLTDQLPMVDLLIDLGLTVVPDATGFETDANGRAWMSLEQVGEVQGETLIMLQTFSAETDGEDESFEDVTATELWQTIPAVQNDRVYVVERVGFPGEITGRRALLAEYRAIFA